MPHKVKPEERNLIVELEKALRKYKEKTDLTWFEIYKKLNLPIKYTRFQNFIYKKKHLPKDCYKKIQELVGLPVIPEKTRPVPVARSVPIPEFRQETKEYQGALIPAGLTSEGYRQYVGISKEGNIFYVITLKIFDQGHAEVKSILTTNPFETKPGQVYGEHCYVNLEELKSYLRKLGWLT